jgi:hypothetical protein
MTTSERPVSGECEWCGEPIEYAGHGPMPRFCRRPRGCRQRAYELRTAAAREARDVDAGRSRPDRVREVIERVEQPRHPSTGPAWVDALAALAEQLHDGPLRHQPWHHPAIRTALQRALAEMPAAAPFPTRPAGSGPSVALGPNAGRILAVLRTAGETSTTLDRLTAACGLPVDVVRVALADLVTAGRVQVTRPGEPRVDVARLAGHSRFTATTT